MRASNLGLPSSDDGTQECNCRKGMLGGRNVWMGLSRERYIIRVLLYARGEVMKDRSMEQHITQRYAQGEAQDLYLPREELVVNVSGLSTEERCGSCRQYIVCKCQSTISTGLSA